MFSVAPNLLYLTCLIISLGWWDFFFLGGFLQKELLCNGLDVVFLYGHTLLRSVVQRRSVGCVLRSSGPPWDQSSDTDSGP